MQGGSKENLNSVNTNSNEPTIVKTDSASKDGQNKCPKCGATDITLNLNNGKLRCNFCRFEFDPVKLDSMNTDVKNLSGEVIGSGATNIVEDSNDVITLKCSSCGAEVVIDTASASQARCHWCRNILSINQQVPNGAIPDVVLPFAITKEDARVEIEKFVHKRRFFAFPAFKKEFTTENIMGVYFPYMIIDVNSHVVLKGEGEHEVRSYTVKNGDSSTTYYDADVYSVERDFDLVINGLTIESSLDKLDQTSKSNTNNVINSIMPFDIENSVLYNANYLRGFTSEKRDTNIEQLKPIAEIQSKDIARYKANDTLKFYDRGVRWDSESLTVKGVQWKAAYLPVWLYSYQQVKGNNKILHYVAVNARTKETMGSVPIHIPKLVITSVFVEILGVLAMMFVDFDYNWIFLSVGIIYYIFMYFRYRNSNARHKYESETKSEMMNVQEQDFKIRSEEKLTNFTMYGANNRSINGKKININLLNISKDNDTNIENDKKES